MKKIILLSFCILSMSSFSQKLKVNEVDKFTKQKVLETSFEKIVSDNNLMGSTGGRLMKNIWVAIKQVSGTNYLRVKWCTNNVLALGEGAHIILLDKEGATYKFENTSFTVAGVGKGTVGMFGSALYGLDIYLTGDFEALNGKEITAMRIHTTDGYIDLDLASKAKSIISDEYKLIKEQTAL